MDIYKLSAAGHPRVAMRRLATLGMGAAETGHCADRDRQIVSTNQSYGP